MYPAIEPYEKGMLDVGTGNLVYWETCGNTQSKPAVALRWYTKFVTQPASASAKASPTAKAAAGSHDKECL